MSRATERRRSTAEWLQFGAAGAIVLVMFYPAIWMVYSSFKSNREIFRSPFALPAQWRWENDHDVRILFLKGKFPCDL